MKKITKILLFVVLSLLLANTISLNAESSLYEDFKNNISSASTKHISYQSTDCRDLHIINSYIEGYIVICEKDNKLYLNLLLINKTTGIEVEIQFKESSKEFTKRTYDVNGNTVIYGLELSSYSDFSLRTLQSDILISVYDYNISDLNSKLSSFGIVTNGTSKFPDNVVNVPAKDKIVNLIIVCGIVFCALLGIVIFVIVKANKVNIRREEPINRFSRNIEPEITNEDVLDVKYEKEEKEQEQNTQAMPSVNDPKYLTELYRKKLNNEISDKEFEAALRRYQNSKDLEDDND